MCKSFDPCSHLPNAWGKTYVVVIPKSKFPKTVLIYRFISLCNVCYGIISKLLSNRLKAVIHKLISFKQSGFLASRSTADIIVALQEVAYSLETDFKTPP